MTNIKNQNKSVMVSFQMPVALREAATKRGTTFSQIIRDALILFINLDDPVWPAIQKMAETFGLPESKIARNIILKYIGEMQAKDEFGAKDMRIVKEFSRTQTGDTLEDNELIAEAKNDYLSILKCMENMDQYMEKESESLKRDFQRLQGNIEK
jgi:hypothetical protein